MKHVFGLAQAEAVHEWTLLDLVTVYVSVSFWRWIVSCELSSEKSTAIQQAQTMQSEYQLVFKGLNENTLEFTYKIKVTFLFSQHIDFAQIYDLRK